MLCCMFQDRLPCRPMSSGHLALRQYFVIGAVRSDSDTRSVVSEEPEGFSCFFAACITFQRDTRANVSENPRGFNILVPSSMYCTYFSFPEVTALKAIRGLCSQMYYRKRRESSCSRKETHLHGTRQWLFLKLMNLTKWGSYLHGLCVKYCTIVRLLQWHRHFTPNT